MVPAYVSTERKRHPEECVCQCPEMWSLQVLFKPSFPMRGLGSTCSVPIFWPSSLRLPGAGLGCLSSFPKTFWCSQLAFGAQLSKVYLSHTQQAGDSNANIATTLAELSDRI